MQSSSRDENEAANSSESSACASDNSAGKPTSEAVSASSVREDGERYILPTGVLKGANISSASYGEQVSCGGDAKDLLDARQGSPKRAMAEFLGNDESKSDSASSVRQSPSPSVEDNDVAGQIARASCSREEVAAHAPSSAKDDDAVSLDPKPSQRISHANPVQNSLASETNAASENNALSSIESSKSPLNVTKAVVTPQEQSPITAVSASTIVTNVSSNNNDSLTSSTSATTRATSSVTLKPRTSTAKTTDGSWSSSTQDTSFASPPVPAPSSNPAQASEVQPTSAKQSSTVTKRASFLVSSTAPKSPKAAYGRPRSNSVPNSPTTSLLIAAAASSSAPAPLPQAAPKLSPQDLLRKSNTPLRRGKWTVEEEAYVARVIQEFNSGFLNAPAGATLRTYLSEKLHCDPMRITKKFTGDACIGKRVFHPAVRCANNAAAIDKAQAELDALERRWRRRLEMQQKESAKKAAASAAAAAAASTSLQPVHKNVANLQPSVPVVPSTHEYKPVPTSVAGTIEPPKQSIVTQTASWLDRAQALLSSKPGSACLPASDRQEMKEVKRLIDEVPSLHHSTSLPCVGTSENLTACKRKVSVEDQEAHPPSSRRSSSSLAPAMYTTSAAQQVIQPTAAGFSGQQQQHQQQQQQRVEEHGNYDKRARRSQSASNLLSLPSSDAAEAKDAEALVGFLNTVRAAAAASSTSGGVSDST